MPSAIELPISGDRPRILIIRLSALGDVVFATALLEGLRTRYPQAHIGWLVQDNFAGILENDPRIDELVVIQRKTLRSPGALLRLRKRLAVSHFEWVIDTQGLAKSRLLAALVPDARRLGFPSREPGNFLLDAILPKGPNNGGIAWEYRHLASQLTGAPAGPPRLTPAADETARVLEQMRQLGLSPGFVAICPFTTRPQKHWMEDYWPRLAQLLSQNPIGPVVMFGGPGDIEAAQKIMGHLPEGGVNLVGKTRLQSVTAWLQQAGLLIGVDTGLTHIGIALRRPVVALFGSTLPYQSTTGSPLRVMYDALPCSPCHRSPTCNGRFDCLRGITPERVAAAAQQLLSTAGPA
ncbi:MAG: glycosyltransferase family 9 protein [Stenotrophobium sp.]